MKLISMTDYVLEKSKECQFKDDCEFAYLVRGYANFLKQPIKLGMFIPCDENDVPYKSYKSFCHVFDKYNFICEPYEGLFEIQANEKSKGWAYLDPERTRYYDKVSYTKAKTDFEKAKERVIFKGIFISENQEINACDVKSVTNGIVHVFWFNSIKGWYLSIGLFEVEDLVKYNLTITDSAIKKYNL